MAEVRFTAQEHKFLIELARQALTECVTHGTLPRLDITQVPAQFHAPTGCFVTLTKQGELRGCIGHIYPHRPLYQAVMENAKSAALDDWRFSPVEPGELSLIEIEISVLTVPQPLTFDSPEALLKKLRPHKDGVVLTIGSYQATFLPQVWEHFEEQEDFLNHLAHKAGVAASAWRKPDAKVLIYQVEAFAEKALE